MMDKCMKCEQVLELRMGYCFDCATAGEVAAAKRTAEEHLRKALDNLESGKTESAKFDVKWALERITKTGDYAPGGYFDSQGINWRAA